MKKLLVGLLLVFFVPAVFGQIVQNYDFSGPDETPWDHIGYIAWGGSWIDLTDDYFRGSGWGDGISWSNNAVWQDTGATFQADTVYTMEIEWRDPLGAPGNMDNVQLVLSETTGWTDVALSMSGPNIGTNVWQTATLVFDTATNPGIVGAGISVGVRNQDVVGGAWMDVNYVSLVPEPATIALLGLGGLALRRRKR